MELCAGTASFPTAASGAESQPVLLSPEPEPANGAANIALADGRWRDEALGFARTFYFFDNDGRDSAREAWRALKGTAGGRGALLEAGRAREMGAGAVSLALPQPRP